MPIVLLKKSKSWCLCTDLTGAKLSDSDLDVFNLWAKTKSVAGHEKKSTKKKLQSLLPIINQWYYEVTVPNSKKRKRK